MGTVILYTLRESFHRRMGIVMFVLALLVAGVFLWAIRFEAQPDGSVMTLMGGRREGPAEKVMPAVLQQQLQFASGPWLILGIFAAAPLLTSFLEKGWAEMQFSKGIPRWQMFLGRYLGALGVFAGSVLLLVAVPVLYAWVGAGVSPGRIWMAMGILLFSYAAILAMIAAVSMALPNPAIPIMLGFLQTILSALLAQRKTVLYDVITAKWAQWLIDWAYRILPKTSELGRLAGRYYNVGEVEWWPVWSSGLFLVGAVGLGIWLLHRKSF